MLGLDKIPPVTSFTTLLLALVYYRIVSLPGFHEPTCLSAQSVWNFRLLLVSALDHVSYWQLFYNMASLLYKGMVLEQELGSLRFAVLTSVFTFLTSTTYILLAQLVDIDPAQCIVGFSPVLFALKVVAYSDKKLDSWNWFHSFLNTDVYTCWPWVELFLYWLQPDAPFLGVVSGILVGILYTQGPIRYIMDTFLGEYSHSTTSPEDFLINLLSQGQFSEISVSHVVIDGDLFAGGLEQLFNNNNNNNNNNNKGAMGGGRHKKGGKHRKNYKSKSWK